MKEKIKTNDSTSKVVIDWQQMYVITENWQSDLAFFTDEICFLKGLMSRYFTHLIDDIENTRSLAIHLSQLETNLEMINKNIKEHIRHLEDHYSNVFDLANSIIIDRHARLEDDMTAFVKSFRATKKEVFSMFEGILKREKGRHLLHD
jgi:hypothetical protein